MNPGSLKTLCVRCQLSTLSTSLHDSWLIGVHRTSYLPRRSFNSWEGRSKPPRHFEGHKSQKGTFDWSNPNSKHAERPRRIFDGHISPKGTFDWSNPKSRFEPVPRARPFLRPKKAYVPPPEIKPENVLEYFEQKVEEWSNKAEMQEILLSFGIPPQDLPSLLAAFTAAVKSKSLSTPECYQAYDLDRFSQPLHIRQSLDVIYSTIFYSWATEPTQRSLLVEKHGVSPDTLDQMTSLARATDRRYLAEDFPDTRRMHRKVIMHVGPTNSGKTHHALRALAAANLGVYAGPLRLLAHEIWERLNLGQIVPAGAERPEFKNIDAEHITEDLPHLEAIKQRGNPKYARLTNMVTGEEQKIVSSQAGLVSVTVEMLSSIKIFDVAVVDEIQMITDPQRGSGWTNAVLGLRAKELHLCGEETAIPVVEALLKGTGDELIIKRYERLTPLKIEEQSLEGDLSKVRKGDAIVTFSRSHIFGIKKAVEKATGLRCAVVYGRLPPEIRSEQATLFNDPDSGYDVLIGSDAIGMGLNLKIRRVIFEAVRKFYATTEELLSISQVKQIAGRAGRFGLHEEPGGSATTLKEEDLSYLHEAVKAPFQSLPFARITFDSDTFARLLPVLPLGSSTATIIHAHHYAGRLPSRVRYQDADFDMAPTFEFIDEFADTLTTRERVLHLNAPVAWRDPLVAKMMRTFLIQARDRMFVDLPSALQATRFMATMEHIEKAMEDQHAPRSNLNDLALMESFHKVLVLYIWLSFRAPILYPQYEKAVEIKERLEKVLEWSLEGMSDARHFKGRQHKASLVEMRDKALPKLPKIHHVNKREMNAKNKHEATKAASTSSAEP